MRGHLIIRRIISMERGCSTHFDGNGTIYQSSNAVYLKRSTPRVLRVLRDGSIFSERAASKIRKADRGWRYAANILVKHGATQPPASPADPTALKTWLRHWTTLLTRPLKHPGNHRYAWSLSDSISLPPSHHYPKWPTPIIQNGMSHS
jgi:hypothetical protein